MSIHSLSQYRERVAPLSRSRSGAASPLLAAPLCTHGRDEGRCFDCFEAYVADLRTVTVPKVSRGVALASLAASLWCFAIAGLVIISGAH